MTKGQLEGHEYKLEFDGTFKAARSPCCSASMNSMVQSSTQSYTLNFFSTPKESGERSVQE